MNTQSVRNFMSVEMMRRCFSPSRPVRNVPEKRILITADLDEPVFNFHMKQVLSLLSSYQTALTVFSPNKSRKGEEGYTVLQRIREFALNRDLTVEIASHSMIHDPLPKNNPIEAASIIQESIESFREKGIPVCGFRSPYLSTENEYRVILKELSKLGGMVQYDSSALFEGNIFTSRLHDLLAWKTPHIVEHVWELPISCLDDYHLFDKLRKSEDFAYAYWTKKIDTCLQKYNYFLLLVHPELYGQHHSVLEDVIRYCRKNHPSARYPTCSELVGELESVRER